MNKHLDKLISKVSKSKDLSDSKELEEAALILCDLRERLSSEIDEVQALETKLRETASNRAIELHGRDWELIEGNGYKLLRVLQGSVYTITGDVSSNFTKQTISVDTDKTTAFLKKNGHLPIGIEPNKNRTERVVLNLK